MKGKKKPPEEFTIVMDKGDHYIFLRCIDYKVVDIKPKDERQHRT